MTITLELAPEVETRMARQASARGVTLQEHLQEVIERAADAPVQADPTLALFAQWEAEDGTNDPGEVESRTREWEELKQNLHVGRLSLNCP